MDYDSMAPTADKWLHSDGSVTTMAGAVILPADSGRAADYASRSPQAAKWLLPDGSIVDSMPGSGGSSGELPKPYYRASCDTPGATVIKDLTGLPDGYVPATGDILLIKFNGSLNSAKSCKFTINGGSAQYTVLFNGLATNTDASAWKPGSIFPFYFDGMNFHQLSYSKEYDNNTTYTGFFEQTAYGFMLKISPDRAFEGYQLAIERPDCTFEKVVTSATSANSYKPVNTGCDFKVDGLIIYNNGTNLAADSSGRATSSILFQTYQDYYMLTYSLNGANHLEAFRWVYLVGIPQENPMVFRLDPGSVTSWYTTTLPTMEDGKVYIKLGFYGGYTNFTLHAEHPAYWFKDGYFRPYLTRGDIS